MSAEARRVSTICKMCEVNAIQYLKELISEKEKLDQEEKSTLIQTLLNNGKYKSLYDVHSIKWFGSDYRNLLLKSKFILL